MEPLPQRFLDLKQQLAAKAGPEALDASFRRLVTHFEKELEEIRAKGPNVVPQVEFAELKANGGRFPDAVAAQVRKRGCVVIKNVIDDDLALQWKAEIKQYLATNGTIGGNPPHNPTMYEVYWSPTQVAARQHPDFNLAAVAMNRLWHADSRTPVDLDHNMSFADRMRIKQPKDTAFHLAEHIDCGSIERWEDPEYRANYQAILDGHWEDYDPFDMTHRLEANMSTYRDSGDQLMFRLDFYVAYRQVVRDACIPFANAHSVGPGKGTLRVCPLIKESTAYTLLRPFRADTMNTTAFPGAYPGHSQVLSLEDHPHIIEAMVSMPDMNPGDCVFWSCDGVHSVEDTNDGTEDASVLYVPAVPICRRNSLAAVGQRKAFVEGRSPPSYPQNHFELHVEGRADEASLTSLGKRLMGFEKMSEDTSTPGGLAALKYHAEVLGF